MARCICLALACMHACMHAGWGQQLTGVGIAGVDSGGEDLGNGAASADDGGHAICKLDLRHACQTGGNAGVHISRVAWRQQMSDQNRGRHAQGAVAGAFQAVRQGGKRSGARDPCSSILAGEGQPGRSP